jgi:hypothetical protein
MDPGLGKVKPGAVALMPARALGHAIFTETEMPKIVRRHFVKDRVIANAWNSEGALGSLAPSWCALLRNQGSGESGFR